MGGGARHHRRRQQQEALLAVELQVVVVRRIEVQQRRRVGRGRPHQRVDVLRPARHRPAATEGARGCSRRGKCAGLVGHHEREELSSRREVVQWHRSHLRDEDGGGELKELLVLAAAATALLSPGALLLLPGLRLLPGFRLLLLLRNLIVLPATLPLAAHRLTCALCAVEEARQRRHRRRIWRRPTRECGGV